MGGTHDLRAWEAAFSLMTSTFVIIIFFLEDNDKAKLYILCISLLSLHDQLEIANFPLFFYFGASAYPFCIVSMSMEGNKTFGFQHHTQRCWES